MGKEIENTPWKNFYKLGKRNLYSQKYSEALKSFSISLKKNNDTYNYLIILQRAKTYFLLNEYKKSFKEYKGIFDGDYTVNDRRLLKPIWGLAYNLVLDLNFEEINEMIGCLEIFSKLIIYGRKYKVKGSSSQGVSFWPTHLTINKYHFDNYWCIGYLNRVLGNYAKSIESFTNARVYLNDGEDRYSWFLADKSKTYISTGNYMEAIKNINYAIKTELYEPWQYGRCFIAHLNAGLIYKEFGDLNMSLSMLNEAVTWIEELSIFKNFETEISTTFINRALIYTKTGKTEECFGDFEMAFSVDKNCSKRHKSLIKEIPEGIKNILRIIIQEKV